MTEHWRGEATVHDRVLVDTPLVRIARFGLRRDDPSFADTGPIRAHLLVVPEIPVAIRPREGEPFVADPNWLLLYHRHQEYRREPVGEDGDRCLWIAFAPELLAEATAVDGRERPADRPFARMRIPTTLADHAAWQLLGRRAEGGGEALRLEETAVSGLARAAAGLRAPASTPRIGDRHARLARRAQTVLGESFVEPLGLAEIARRVGCSGYHLCRVFRAATGSSLHEYRTQLRLRTAVRVITARREVDLSALAHDLGFSSHSHFTTVYRRAFGEPPSALRLRTTAGRDRHSASGPPRR